MILPGNCKNVKFEMWECFLKGIKMAAVESVAFCTDISFGPLYAGLDEQRRDGTFCDLILKVNGRSVATHSCVIAIFSPWMMSIVAHNRPWPYVPSAPEEVELDISEGEEDLFEALQCVIGYIYTGKMDVHHDNVDKVLKVAEILKVAVVTSLCSSWKFLNQPQKPLDADLPQPCSPVVEETVPDVTPSPPRCHGIRNKRSSLRKAAPDFTSDGSEVDDEEDDDDDDDARVNATEGRYACCKCPFKSTSALEMQDHRRVHWGKSYRCNTCGFLAIQAPKLLAHLCETRHGGTVCSLCNFEAENVDNMQEHLKEHDDRKPFFCCTCGQRFKTRTALGLHLPKHSTSTPFVCDVCAKGFKWKHALQSHMAVHAENKRFLCDQCGYRTSHKSSLKSHRLLHTGNAYKCSHPGCSFQSVRKQNLKQHSVTHTKEKPYRCTVCSQSFSLSKNLRRHARIHNTDGNQLRCASCPFTTTRADKLKQHSKKYHYQGDYSSLQPAGEEPIIEGPLDVLMVAAAQEHEVHKPIEVTVSTLEVSSSLASVVQDGGIQITDVIYTISQ